MAFSESGNSKGKPFMSTLFKKHNNPFGIKGNGGEYKTIEYYNGIKTQIVDGFRHFADLQNAIEYLVRDFLTTPRYDPLRSSSNYKEFFSNLRKCGYFTHPSWDTYYLIPTYEYFNNIMN
jgi:flagellum-specific peptidoglycan hydrolase FlgJ